MRWPATLIRRLSGGVHVAGRLLNLFRRTTARLARHHRGRGCRRPARDSLAHDDGVGALQFSIALYESGPRPRGDVEDRDLDGFAESHGWAPGSDPACETSPHVVAASFRPGEDFVAVWYVSEGSHFAFVTYTCERSDLDAGERAEEIVRSLAFGEPTAG